MTVGSSDLTVLQLSQYIDIQYSCLQSKYSTEYNFAGLTPGQSIDHIKFDENNFKIEIKTNALNQMDLSGLQ